MSSPPKTVALNLSPENVPKVRLADLDTLWFQVSGTICNLRCNHCFISCSPENDKFGFLGLETCRRYLDESKNLGVKEYYFTGGEPFANPQMCDILELALSLGPATVLTNGMLFRQSTLERLERIEKSSIYSLELRVSLDGYTAEMNDPIRGEGTFDGAVAGIIQLTQRGFLPIITIARSWEGEDSDVLVGFVEMLKSRGYDRPRVKILPMLKMGAEVERTSGYAPHQYVTHTMMQEYDQSQLVCSSARLVTDQGVWVCPILLDEPAAKLGESLGGALGEYPLRHQACYTCWQYGAICSNVSTAASATTDG